MPGGFLKSLNRVRNHSKHPHMKKVKLQKLQEIRGEKFEPLKAKEMKKLYGGLYSASMPDYTQTSGGKGTDGTDSSDDV